jgi:hypothetical protein
VYQYIFQRQKNRLFYQNVDQFHVFLTLELIHLNKYFLDLLVRDEIQYLPQSDLPFVPLY